MLFYFTLLIDYGAMAVTLWLAFYLLGRGFPSQIALRVVVVLLALSLFFSSAFLNFFRQIEGATALRAVLLVIALGTWYSLTYELLPVRDKKKLHWMRILIYIYSFITAATLLSAPVFVGEKENLLYVGRMGVGPPYILYGGFQILSVSGILYNLLTGEKIGLKSQGRFLLLASLFPLLAAAYGILALALTPPMPRLIQDLLIFSGVFLLGISVARYQLLLERRITILDLPVSGLAVLGLAAVYTLLAWQMGFQTELVAAVTLFAVLTHSIYDLVREILGRMLVRSENTFRRQLHQIELEVSKEMDLRQCLQEGLNLLCRTLNASGGFIAVLRGETFVVAASRQAIPLGSHLLPSEVTLGDISQPRADRLPAITWLAPVFEAETQIGVIGIGHPENKLHYSSDDLDLLAEVSERVGTIISLSSLHPGKVESQPQFSSDGEFNSTDLRTRTEELIATMTTNPDPELIKMVEEGLRHLSDFITLGQLEFARWMDVRGETHIERGKRLQRILIEGIESLRPAGPRPGEPLPKVWYNYAILHDAYVDCVPNNEIIARLYISEGTFNRTRRNALRGLARLFLEKQMTFVKE